MTWAECLNPMLVYHPSYMASPRSINRTYPVLFGILHMTMSQYKCTVHAVFSYVHRPQKEHNGPPLRRMADRLRLCLGVQLPAQKAQRFSGASMLRISPPPPPPPPHASKLRNALRNQMPRNRADEVGLAARLHVAIYRPKNTLNEVCSEVSSRRVTSRCGCAVSSAVYWLQTIYRCGAHQNKNDLV